MYWQMRWSPTQNGHGVTEGGSSGSPLFSNDGYIVGQLTGGQASCANPNAPDYYGKFAVSWESNGTTPDRQLKPWLDPANTGVQTLRGTYNELQVIAGFIADTVAIQTGGSIGFSDISIGDPTQWHWIFEGGEPNESFQKDPDLITYNRFGKYDVTLIVSNDHYTDTLVRENYIQIVPGIFPNPAIDYVTMLLGDHNEQLLVLEITDIAGRPFGTYEYKIGNAYSIKIDTTPLVSGMYVITASFGNNFFSRQKLFVTR
jgi:lysyl endopeptidase